MARVVEMVDLLVIICANLSLMATVIQMASSVWTGHVIFASALGALGFALSVYNTIAQMTTKNADLLEARWERQLARLARMRFRADDRLAGYEAAELFFYLSCQNMTGDATLEDFARGAENYVQSEPFAPETPEGLLSTFEAIASLYKESPKKRLPYLLDAYFSEVRSVHVMHALLRAIQKRRTAVGIFLIESESLDRFIPGSLAENKAEQVEALRNAFTQEE